METEARVRQETSRYLGYGNQDPDSRTEELITQALREIRNCAVPASVSKEMPLLFDGKDGIQIGADQFRSKNLAQNLKGCGQVILFAATLGASVDRLIQKYSRLDMAKAVILQAASAAVLEEYCDSRNRYLAEEAVREGWYLRPRFSPGYGDFPISFQKKLIAVLTAEKRIGLTVTDACMLVPVKSVTAVIGMSRTDSRCILKGCEVCKKADCVYRRNRKNTKEE